MQRTAAFRGHTRSSGSTRSSTATAPCIPAAAIPPAQCRTSGATHSSYSLAAPSHRCRSTAGAPRAVAAAAAALGNPPDKLSEPEQREQWSTCVLQLMDIGFEEEVADRLVARAFGWGTQVRGPRLHACCVIDSTRMLLRVLWRFLHPHHAQEQHRPSSRPDSHDPALNHMW